MLSLLRLRFLRARATRIPEIPPTGGAMLISPMLFIVRGQRLLVSHRAGASRALRAPSPGAASLRYARPPTKPLDLRHGKRLAVAAAFL